MFSQNFVELYRAPLSPYKYYLTAMQMASFAQCSQFSEASIKERTSALRIREQLVLQNRLQTRPATSRSPRTEIIGGLAIPLRYGYSIGFSYFGLTSSSGKKGFGLYVTSNILVEWFSGLQVVLQLPLTTMCMCARWYIAPIVCNKRLKISKREQGSLGW